jgi:hypothetical protein
MASNGTEQPPVSVGGDPAPEASPEADSKYLKDLISTGSTATPAVRFTRGDIAAELVNRSADGLVAMILAGRLDAVVRAGELHVPTAQLQQVARDLITDDTMRTLTLRTQTRIALRAYLDDVEVTDDWDIARAEFRPLVTARRGHRHLSYGIEYHGVVLHPGWVARWALDRRPAYPELATLPTGPTLRLAMAELSGVDEVHHAVPLNRPGTPTHRIHGWVRLNAREWPLNVPDAIADVVDGRTR